jgi:hypothetical protein
MTVPSSPSPHESAGRWGQALPVAFLVSIFLLAGILAINESRLRPALDARRASATEAEDRAFCSKFGAGPHSGRYLECVSALNGIRSSHAQRSADLFY